MAEFTKAFVLGHPVTHSRSPLIHNHWIKTHGLHGHYTAIDVAPGTLAGFLKCVRSGEFAGGNITVPLKEEAYAAVDCLTDTAKSIGAVNTVYRQDQKLWGDNTDAYGFSANLSGKALDWNSANTALVIGAGGAGRAIVQSLLSAGFSRIKILNRTVERAQDLALAFGPKMSAGALHDFARCAFDCSLIVNTSSMGMSGSAPVEFDFSTANPSAIVTDIVYVPLETAFLAAARGAGLKTVDGLGMLLHQAVPGFERWFGVRPKVTPQLRTMIEADLFKAKKG